jgi:serine/threonine protein kinase
MAEFIEIRTMTEELIAGQLIDRRYQIQKMIGKGGFGRTYLAIDTRQFNHPCVLKEFVPTGDSKFVIQKSYELFRQEAATLYNLAHPQIPKFYGLLEDDGKLFIVQDYVDGKSYWDLLQSYRQQNRRFTEAEITQWLQDLLPVLDYIHSHNIVHRDISPDNILLPNGKNQPVLIDFGVVKQVETEVRSVVGNSANPPSIVGKLGYAPLEQIRMGKCSPSSDLYSLGVTAVVLLTGQDDPNQLLDSNMEWQWESFALVSDRLTAILKKMLTEKPQQRYQSAQEVLLDLTGHETVHFIPSSTPVPSPKTSIPPATLISRLPENPNITPNTTIVSPSQPLPAASARSPIKKQMIAIGVLLALVMGGVGVQSGHIPGVCQQLNNCAKDKAAEADYQEAVEQSKAGESSAKSAKTLQDLQTARDRIQSSTETLKAIASDTKIHADAQKKLKSTQEVLAKVQTRLDQETKASATLSKAQKEGQAAEQKVKMARTIANYDAAIASWQGAIVALQKLPPKSFVTSQVTELITTYESKIADANQQISLLSPAPQPATIAAPIAASATAPSVAPAHAAPSYEPPPSYEPAPSYEPVPSYEPPAPVREEPLWGGGNSGGGQPSQGGAPLW